LSVVAELTAVLLDLAAGRAVAAIALELVPILLQLPAVALQFASVLLNLAAVASHLVAPLIAPPAVPPIPVRVGRRRGADQAAGQQSIQFGFHAPSLGICPAKKVSAGCFLKSTSAGNTRGGLRAGRFRSRECVRDRVRWRAGRRCARDRIRAGGAPAPGRAGRFAYPRDSPSGGRARTSASNRGQRPRPPKRRECRPPILRQPNS